MKNITVVLSNGTTHNVKLPLTSLPVSETLQSVLKDKELVKQYQIATSKESVCVPQESQNLWCCACGTWNNSDTCTKCEVEKNKVFDSLDIPILTTRMDERIKQETVEREKQAELNKIAKEEANKQRKKLITLITAISIPVIVIISIIAGISYNKAQHKYDDIAGTYIPQLGSNAGERIANFQGLEWWEFEYDANDYSIEIQGSGKISGSLWYINERGNFYPGRAKIVGCTKLDKGIEYQIEIVDHPDAIVTLTLYADSKISTYNASNDKSYEELTLPYEKVDSSNENQEDNNDLTDTKDDESSESNTTSTEQTTTQQTEAHKHNYVISKEKAATCTAKGVKTWACNECGDTYDEDISAVGHSWKDVNCSAPRKCSNCGAEEEKAIGHNWVKNESKPVVCSRCSQKYPCNVSFEYASDIIGELGITPEVRIDSIDISQEAHYNSYDDVIYAYLVVTITGHNTSTYYESVTVDIGEVWEGGGKVEFFIPSGDFNMSEWTLVDDLNGTYYVDVVG